jgi:hypothetical protein
MIGRPVKATTIRESAGTSLARHRALRPAVFFPLVMTAMRSKEERITGITKEVE